jgi:GDP-4-dehydro-6-deoxy-D-mannose reductase
VLLSYLSSLPNVTLIGLTSSIPDKKSPDSRGIEWVQGDIRDRNSLEALVHSVGPERVIHLAALNYGQIEEMLMTNVAGTWNLLSAARKANQASRILVVSSSAVYGYAGTRPIIESAPLAPLSGYGVSKAAQELLALQHHAVHGMQIAVARPFNLIGPAQPESFVCGKIVGQVIRIENGMQESLSLLETRSARDFLDVRDAVAGYWAIIAHPEFSRACAGKAFNLGSGTPHSVAEVIAALETITGRHYPVTLPKKVPSVIIPTQQSDNSRVQSLTGWAPHIPLRDSLSDMLETARKKAGEA